jgi:hypothetical protein
MQRFRADETSCVLLKRIAVRTRESTSQFFVPLLHNPVGVGQCRFFFSRSRWLGIKKWRVLPVNFPACAPGGPGCGWLATPQRSARRPLLVPGVPCTMSGCVYPRGNRGGRRDARNRVMQTSHPPMPCDPPCLVARPYLYSARQDCQPRLTCGCAPTRAAGRLVPTTRFSLGDRSWPRHPRLDAMPRFPMSR